jgi:hypothetical protein
MIIINIYKAKGAEPLRRRQGLLEVRTVAAASTAMPVAVFELSLGVWLVVKGFSERQSPPKR